MERIFQSRRGRRDMELYEERQVASEVCRFIKERFMGQV